MRVLIVGAGGHGQVVADILRCARAAGEDIDPIGYLDDDPTLAGKTFVDLPVLGSVTRMSGMTHDGVIVAVGDSRARRRVYETLQARGERFVAAVHPSAVIAADVRVGAGCMICAGVVINTGTTIGVNTILNTACSVDHHNTIGDHVHVAPGVHTGGEVSIGEGALVGIGATILPRVQVGRRSVVGAGAVVCRDIPDDERVVGVPARRVESVK